jgi:hypothetical protein
VEEVERREGNEGMVARRGLHFFRIGNLIVN